MIVWCYARLMFFFSSGRPTTRFGFVLRLVVCSSYVLGIAFFFFQAEDGIRDLTVTGVQTCALPIWPRAALAGAEKGSAGLCAGPPGRRWRGRPGRPAAAGQAPAVLTTRRVFRPRPPPPPYAPALSPAQSPPPPDRKSTRLNSSHSQISYAVFC